VMQCVVWHAVCVVCCIVMQRSVLNCDAVCCNLLQRGVGYAICVIIDVCRRYCVCSAWCACPFMTVYSRRA